jgi:hypothetical protein
MKRARATFALLTVIAIVPAVSQAGTSQAHDARVVGVIRLCGGPAPGGCFNQNGVVSVLNSEHQVVASEHTTHAGAFAFELAPGAYTLQASTGGTHGRNTVVAHAHKTTTANVVIPIP